MPSEEDVLGSGGEKDDTTEEVLPNKEVLILGLTRGDKVVAWAAGMLAIGESRGPT